MPKNIKKVEYFDDERCGCSQCELKTAFFQNVTRKEINILCIEKKTIFAEKGETVIKQGERIQDFIYLKSGLVKISRLKNDVQQIINIAKPFDFVSLLSVFSDIKYKYSITALADSELCKLDIQKVKDLISRNGDFAFDILTKMSKITDKVLNSSLDIRQKNIAGRVAYVLLYFSNEIFNSNEFELPISRKEFAELIGKTTENVVRNLTDFKRSKILKIYGKSIEIVDKNRLQQISDFG